MRKVCLLVSFLFCVYGSLSFGVFNALSYAQNSDIWDERIKASTTSASFAITSLGNDQTLLGVVYNSNTDEFFIMMDHKYSSNDYDIFAQRVGGSGSLISGTRSLIASGAIELGRAIAFNPLDNEYLLAWSTKPVLSDHYYQKFYVQRVSATGDMLGTALLLIEIEQKNDKSNLNLAYNLTNSEYLAVWSNGVVIAGQRIARNGTKIGDPFTILTFTDGKSPQISYNSVTNQYLLIWSHEDVLPTGNCSKNLYVQALSSSGSALGSYYSLYSSTSPCGLVYATSFNRLAQQYLLVWNESSDGSIVGQLLNGSGNVMGNGFLISSVDGRSRQVPVVTYSASADEYVVAWELTYRPSDTDIYHRRITRPGSEVANSSLTSIEGGPAIAANSQSGFLIAWTDNRNSSSTGFDIYGELVVLASPTPTFTPTNTPTHTPTATPTVTPTPTAKTSSIGGKVLLERRSNNAGSQICLEANCITTSTTGDYQFNSLPINDYSVTVRRPSYLRTERRLSLPEGSTTLADIVLLAGDIHQDDVIEIADSDAIAKSFNSVPSASNWNPLADITDDQVVNILDMTAVQFNWDQRAPGPWPQIETAALTGVTRKDVSNVAVINISPATTTVPTGTTSTLKLVVNNITDLYSARITLQFDPTILHVKDADPDTKGVQVRAGDFLNPQQQFVIVNQTNNLSGTIDFAVTQLAPAQGQSGAGTLALLDFQVINAGISPIIVTKTKLLDSTFPIGQELAVERHHGEIIGSSQHALFLPIISK